MSLATWKKEFYRTPANKVSKRYALKHSLKKWLGLKPANKKKHGVVLRCSVLVDKKDEDKCFEFDCENCSLCCHFNDDVLFCEKCPLVKTGTPECAALNSPWTKFHIKNTAAPMIKALQKAVDQEKKK